MNSWFFSFFCRLISPFHPIWACRETRTCQQIRKQPEAPHHLSISSRFAGGGLINKQNTETTSLAQNRASTDSGSISFRTRIIAFREKRYVQSFYVSRFRVVSRAVPYQGGGHSSEHPSQQVASKPASDETSSNHEAVSRSRCLLFPVLLPLCVRQSQIDDKGPIPFLFLYARCAGDCCRLLMLFLVDVAVAVAVVSGPRGCRPPASEVGSWSDRESHSLLAFGWWSSLPDMSRLPPCGHPGPRLGRRLWPVYKSFPGSSPFLVLSALLPSHISPPAQTCNFHTVLPIGRSFHNG